MGASQQHGRYIKARMGLEILDLKANGEVEDFLVIEEKREIGPRQVAVRMNRG
jgi:hypothetical protein